MICPNCDGILGGGYCQGCGWRTGDPWPAHRLVLGSTHPLKARELYPPEVVGVKVGFVAEMPAPTDAAVISLHEATATKVAEELSGIPTPEPQASVKTPLDKTVQ